MSDDDDDDDDDVYLQHIDGDEVHIDYNTKVTSIVSYEPARKASIQ
jgi:hypothetical protein